ncbi:hypothetical protein ABL78_4615 [Leptomonas seymouri]|uniref:Schlafen AlbA-2 domain-containing protein n=1 Tax=Leptomonas seymouri TaxID=5684 RepID=A0A0N1HWA8_LEPSE|nr:hypothetical protein ABL78_4615 [Leptomonas seymouri]|eukprot:KPI86310.1 hypothetical protein ABL78_4615 [Leptomonas seymouri]
MQIDLSRFFNARGALVSSDGAELAVARAFAAAANAAPKAYQPITAPECIAVELSVRSKEASWSRQLKDAVLRCVDRAMGRVCPPLDVLQYISDDSPAFRPCEGVTSDGAARVVFSIRPTAALLPPSLLKQHTVEGQMVQGVELPGSEDAAALTATASEVRKDTISDMDLWYRARAAHQRYDSSIPLESIQQLAGSLLGPGDGVGGGGSGGGAQDGELLQAQQKQQEEKLEQLQWQLARWLTEFFLNEGGWARARGSSSASATALPRQNGNDAAVRRLFSGPLRPAFPHVVDAALFSGPSPLQQSALTSVLPAAADAIQRRQLHADVRGMEWDGLLVGYTTRYAYIAVPYWVSAEETTMKVTASSSLSSGPTCVWTLVSRLPIPAFVRGEVARRVAGRAAEETNGVPQKNKRDFLPPSSGETRKRKHADTDAEANTAASFSENRVDALLSQAVLSRCFNVDEVMRHDTNAAAAFRLTEVPYIVTVRAHRVYCARANVAKQPQLLQPNSRSTSLCARKPHPAASPYKLSMILEDAYAVGYRPAAGRDDTTASGAEDSSSRSSTHWAAALFGVEAVGGSDCSTASSLAHSLHTFPDVVGVVRESCHRFVRSHERFHAMYKRCLERGNLKATAPPPPQMTTTAVGVSDGGEGEARPTEGRVGETAEKPASSEYRDLPSQAVAAQQLRLLRRAEAVYGSIADSMSVHYKKLRGASRVAIPTVHTSADVPALEESHNVEFKAKVGLTQLSTETSSPHSSSSAGARRGCGRQASTMDTERLRNTIAAMAACRGGLILIGVADDGRIVGHAKQLEVSKQLRTSGFCPAMFKGAVQVKELRCLEVNTTTASEAPAKRAMPENWWKAGSASPKAGPDRSATLKTADGAASEQVITVISVEKGQAPFYATAKNTPPYQRGCASTVIMPTVVLARRLMKELA